jgi:hypothetical protein
MASAEFSILSGILSLGEFSSEVQYCASDVSISYTAESLSFLCMDESTPTRFPGQESWNGSCTLAYDAQGMSQLWGLDGSLIFVVNKSSGGDITFTGLITISDVSAVFNKNEVPTVTVTFEGNGDLTEQVNA